MARSESREASLSTITRVARSRPHPAAGPMRSVAVDSLAGSRFATARTRRATLTGAWHHGKVKPGREARAGGARDRGSPCPACAGTRRRFSRGPLCCDRLPHPRVVQCFRFGAATTSMRRWVNYHHGSATARPLQSAVTRSGPARRRPPGGNRAVERTGPTTSLAVLVGLSVTDGDSHAGRECLVAPDITRSGTWLPGGQSRDTN